MVYLLYFYLYTYIIIYIYSFMTASAGTPGAVDNVYTYVYITFYL